MSYGTPPGYGGGGGYGAPPPGGGYGGYGQPPQQPYGGAGGGGGYQSPPPNYLVWAILTLFCCQILGIISIVFAAQVNGKYAAGDYAGALDSSSKARTFAMIGTILGVVQWIFVILYFVFIGVMVSHSTPDPYITSTY